MKIGIVDADLIGRDKHRFPNLACEKISAYWKERNADVILLTNYDWNVDDFDNIYISKVFTDTPAPEWIMNNEKIHIGGTGFFFDQAENLLNKRSYHHTIIESTASSKPRTVGRSKRSSTPCSR